jgi:hypothetical protein
MISGMTQAKEPKADKRKGVLGWSWTGFDLLLVLGALVIGSLIWFIPAFWDTPELRAFYQSQKELKAQRLAIEAEEARIQKEREDLGIVYLPPPPPKAAPSAKPAPPAKAPAKPAARKKDS